MTDLLLQAAEALGWLVGLAAGITWYLSVTQD